MNFSFCCCSMFLSLQHIHKNNFVYFYYTAGSLLILTFASELRQNSWNQYMWPGCFLCTSTSVTWLDGWRCIKNPPHHKPNSLWQHLSTEWMWREVHNINWGHMAVCLSLQILVEMSVLSCGVVKLTQLKTYHL